jgi:hypothetical protein
MAGVYRVAGERKAFVGQTDPFNDHCREPAGALGLGAIRRCAVALDSALKGEPKSKCTPAETSRGTVSSKKLTLLISDLFAILICSLCNLCITYLNPAMTG